mmetsp:Transcript_47393/g.131791  ORF Transcript_47393/g.131791 Transcript_47393/m.131791 type:complete len:214 (-) Transcript_47393:988-1629(-)
MVKAVTERASMMRQPFRTFPRWLSLKTRARHCCMRRTHSQKSAPVSPKEMPMTQKGTNSQTFQSASLSGNSMKPVTGTNLKPSLHAFATKDATHPPRNARQVSCGYQKDEASSREKSRPPIGAPKAAATPMEAPRLMNSSFVRWLSRPSRSRSWQCNMELRPMERPAAVMAPTCAIGPSVPAKSPEDVTKIRPMTRQNQVLAHSMFGSKLPFR